jgi:hypothetical protein
MDRDEIEFLVTQRLLEFYDGLMERGQILPPIQLPVQENRVRNSDSIDRIS